MNICVDTSRCVDPPVSINLGGGNLQARKTDLSLFNRRQQLTNKQRLTINHEKKPTMLRYGITIFLSAFLLFQVQPMIAKFILPWFGGTAAVWTTCMMFFQIVLLLGYSYAHLLRLLFKPRTAWLIHIGLLVVAVLFCQVAPSEAWQPAGGENLTLGILMVLAATIGLPFFVLSTTGPLVQVWQSTSHRGRSPYRLYALSNLGSMLALISYPFLFERFMPLASQATWWSVGFLAFAGFCCWSGWQTINIKDWEGEADPTANSSTQRNSTSSSIGWMRPMVWVLLTMAASVMLLATTNLMCQEIASVPFLWILPLSLYLLSFIICFDRPAWYKRRIFMPLLVISTFISIALVHLNVKAGIMMQIGGLVTVCFASAMTCHGELERLKPEVRYLTGFYLLVAVGGALGGIFVAVIAPHIFTGFYEFHLALLICLLVPLVILVQEYRHRRGAVSKPVIWILGSAIMLAATFVVCSLVYFVDESYHPTFVYQSRNEYGLVSVLESGQYRRFINGRIEHGGQNTDPAFAMEHTSYYMPGSGVSIAVESFRDYLKSIGSERGLRVCVLGLGAGGMMTWGETGDQFDFYEINPLVEGIARNYFTYLSAGAADSRVVLGDGRVQLQRHADNDGQKYDLIFMDAFASDSIPIHLITSECFDVYEKNLDENGIIIVHISNRFVDLRPVVYQSAIERGMTPILVDFRPRDKGNPTVWVLLTKNQSICNSDLVRNSQTEWPTDMKPVRWTDDYASLAAQLKWSNTIDWKSIMRTTKTPSDPGQN